MHNKDKTCRTQIWQRQQKKKILEEELKIKSDNFLKTLSLVSSETFNEINDVLIEFSKFQILIDEKLIPALELVQYENKYELINRIKEECLNIAFYLHYQELIGKTVIGFDSIVTSNIYNIILKECLDEEVQNHFLWNLFIKKQEKVALSDNIPTVISSFQNTSMIKVLNISENIIPISNVQYIDFLTYSFNEDIDISSLIHGILVPGNIKNDIAVIVLPENVDTSKKYYEAYCEAIDILVIDVNKFDVNKLSKYKNLKEVIVVGNVNKKEKANWKNYVETRKIKIRYELKTDNAIKNVISADYNRKNNFCYLTVISNLLYENTWHLANKHGEFKNFIELINEDILFKCKETEICLKNIQQKYKEELAELEKVYFEYKKISDSLLEMLLEIQEKVAIKENTLLENQTYCVNNHICIERIYMDFLIKLVETYKSFPEQNSKDIIRKYCNIYTTISGKKNLEDLFVKVMFKEMVNGQFLIDDYQENMGELYFLSRYIIKYSELLEIPIEKCIDLLVMNYSVDRGKNFSPKENFLLGLYKMKNGDSETAKENLMLASILGNIDASNVLHKNFELTVKELQILAENGEMRAAYKLGKMILNDSFSEEDEFSWEDAIKYLHIAAANGNLKAIKMLGDEWYDEFYYAEEEEDDEEDDLLAEKALYYYLLAEKNGSNDKKIFERIGYLSYELEKYNNAMEYFSKAETANAFYYLGLMYEEGDGCAANESKALEYYEKSMNEGHAEAAVQYERLNAEIIARNKKNFANESVNYSSTSYYSGYYSYYSSGW